MVLNFFEIAHVENELLHIDNFYKKIGILMRNNGSKAQNEKTTSTCNPQAPKRRKKLMNIGDMGKYFKGLLVTLRSFFFHAT